ncbi:hypothetical protein V866_007683 [Kwoniella sp. B9012]
MQNPSNTETESRRSSRDTDMLSKPPAINFTHSLREIIITTKDQAKRILSIITQSYQDIPSDKWLYDGEPGAERCCKIWTSSYGVGDIQSVMAYELPHKAYEAQEIRHSYAVRLWGHFPEDKVDRSRDESGDVSDELRATLEVNPKDSTEVQFLFTDPSSRSQGHGAKSIEKMKEISERNELPFWLSAHNDGGMGIFDTLGQSGKLCMGMAMGRSVDSTLHAQDLLEYTVTAF